jgi:hypothetical protein
MLFKKTIFLAIFALCAQNLVSQTLITPKDHFGFEPGSDGNLFTYEQLIEYLKILDKNSDKIKLEEIGKSPMGKPLFIAFISSKENIKNLENLKNINKQLALEPQISEQELTKFTHDGKVFVLATLSMHSSEVGPSQSAPLIAYNLITSQDSETKDILNNVVYMMVPCHNPDGMNMVVNHFNKYKGTKYEGSSLPGVYHKYVGHDNNRDFVVLSQSDTKAISEITGKTWFPQVMVEKHQMGSTGPRFFVPPFHDPISENNDAELYAWIGLFGQNMLNDMTAKGQKGISQHYIFDNYWVGSTETCLWKNVISFLTEAASAKYAKPIYIEPTELKVYGKGLSEYKKSTNMLEPWPGGWWRLGDIVNIEIESTYSILKTASTYKERILKFRNNICKKEINKGLNQPRFITFCPKTKRIRANWLHWYIWLQEHGIQVHQLNEDILANNYLYKKVILL